MTLWVALACCFVGFAFGAWGGREARDKQWLQVCERELDKPAYRRVLRAMANQRNT